jgi:hypothetical protein
MSIEHRRSRESVFGHGSAWTVCGKLGSRQAVRSTAVDSDGDGASSGTASRWPGGTDAAGGLASAGADFEELGAPSFDLCRARGLGQLPAEVSQHLRVGCEPSVCPSF